MRGASAGWMSVKDIEFVSLTLSMHASAQQAKAMQYHGDCYAYAQDQCGILSESFPLILIDPFDKRKCQNDQKIPEGRNCQPKFTDTSVIFEGGINQRRQTPADHCSSQIDETQE